jgi:hypothetical protein
MKQRSKLISITLFDALYKMNKYDDNNYTLDHLSQKITSI